MDWDFLAYERSVIGCTDVRMYGFVETGLETTNSIIFKLVRSSVHLSVWNMIKSYLHRFKKTSITFAKLWKNFGRRRTYNSHKHFIILFPNRICSNAFQSYVNFVEHLTVKEKLNAFILRDVIIPLDSTLWYRDIQSKIQRVRKSKILSTYLFLIFVA